MDWFLVSLSPWCLISDLIYGIWPKTLEKVMALHSSTLAWKIPWREEPGRLLSMGSLRVWYDGSTSVSLFTFMHWRRKCNPLQCSCLENPRDGRAWWAALYGVSQSWTQLNDFSFTFHFHALEKKWQPTPVFLPGESQGWRSLVGCHLWGHTESDRTDVT